MQVTVKLLSYITHDMDAMDISHKHNEQQGIFFAHFCFFLKDIYCVSSGFNIVLVGFCTSVVELLLASVVLVFFF